MPRYSAFTPYGMFRFSAEPSTAEKIYQSMRESQGGDDGPFREFGYQGAKLYAQSMGLARVNEYYQRIRDQHNSSKTTFLLSEMEEQYGITPDTSRTEAARRAKLSSRKKAGRALEANVRAGLAELLGSDFIDIYTSNHPDFTDLVNNFATTPPAEANFHLPTTSGWGIAIEDNGPPNNKLRYVAIDSIRGLASVSVQTFKANEIIVFGSHNGSLIQKAQILNPGVATEYIAEYDKYIFEMTLTAPLTKAVQAGQAFTSSTFPWFPTGRQHFLIFVKPAVAFNAALVADVHDFMARSVRVSSVWQITTSPDLATNLGFKINESLIGFSTFAEE